MFSVFSDYPTFLVFLAVVISAALTMALMPLWIRMLRSSHIGQQVRADGPQSHLVKQGTPTMGGVVMLIAVAVQTAVIFAMYGKRLDRLQFERFLRPKAVAV